jgi:WD40 repeat protein
VNQVTDLVTINSDLLASSSIDSIYIRIWSVTTYAVRYSLSGHTNAVNCLKQVSSSVLASASEDRTIRLWSLTNGRIIRTLTGHTLGVTSLDLFSSQVLASGSKDQTIKLWNVNTGALVTTINAGASIVSIGAVNPIVIGIKIIFCLNFSYVHTMEPEKKRVSGRVRVEPTRPELDPKTSNFRVTRLESDLKTRYFRVS